MMVRLAKVCLFFLLSFPFLSTSTLAGLEFKKVGSFGGAYRDLIATDTLLYALAGERHWHLPTRRLDLVGLAALHFEAPDADRFPCLRLAREAGRQGGRSSIVLNAANEVAVAALLAARIRYVDIAGVIERTLEAVPPASVTDLEEALATDRLARETATGFLD